MQKSALAVRLGWPLVLVAALTAVACGDDDKKEEQAVNTDALGLDVVLPDGERMAGLTMAAEDLVQGWASIKGMGADGEHVVTALGDVDAAEVVEVVVDADAGAGDEGYTIETVTFLPGRTGLRITASTDVGAMYGLYEVAGDIGVRYIHPEQTVYPSNEALSLPGDYDGELVTPAFTQRGFHEHTQHPIVMSDFMLRPEARFRPFVSNYLKWMARNRQNVLSFHMLKTVDLEAWTPYMQDIVAEANSYGVEIGAFIGFVDEQQNAYKMIRTNDEPEEDQIKRRMDAVLAGGLNQIGFQIGASEFTKPADADIIRWMQIAMDHIKAEHSDVRAVAWIHITCSLEDEEGGYYFHLPLKADADLASYVHTTMFYTLDHPAPVYDCETFEHQIEYMEQANGTRDQIFFPETAWWLGFDNNAPVVLPITGFSREYDITEILPNHDVTGHVTFTTGREWTYWQYDHHLTQITWDGQTSWKDYLAWLAPVYGENGDAMVEALGLWTDLQVQHFYDETPLLYFYVAGELDQDEVGEQAGILARRPKPSFQSILELDGAAFEAWQDNDLAALKVMMGQYQQALEPLPETLANGADDQKVLYEELYTSLYVYVRRVEHAVELYEGVEAMRPWLEEVRAAAAAQPPREPDESIRESAQAAAQEHLDNASAITQDVLLLFGQMESIYRYPLDLLIEPKPDTKTAYPYGYLEQTSTGFFWTRRDEQLQRLIERTFAPINEEWEQLPNALFLTNSGLVELVVPEDALAGTVIPSFMPQLLFGLQFDPDTPLGESELTLRLAQDFNRNLLPDEETEQSIEGAFGEEGLQWSGVTESYPLTIRDSAGDVIGQLSLVNATFTLNLVADDSDGLDNLENAGVVGQVATEDLVALINSVGGLDRESTENLIKGLYEVAPEDALPELLPIEFAFEFTTAGQ